MRTAAYRLADLQPIDSLAAVHVVNLLKNLERSQLAFAKLHKLSDMEAETAKRMASLKAWEAGLKKPSLQKMRLYE